MTLSSVNVHVESKREVLPGRLAYDRLYNPDWQHQDSEQCQRKICKATSLPKAEQLPSTTAEELFVDPQA